MDIENLKPHPLADILPLLDDEQLKELADDIKKTGRLLEPITIFEDQILDGRNRYNAVKKHGLKFGPDDWREFDPETEGDPAVFVYSKNILRRHLTVGQRSAYGAELVERMAKRPVGRPKELSAIADNIPSAKENVKKAAAVVGVSPASVEKAGRLKKANPDLFQDVAAGTTTLHTADKERKERKKAKRQQRKIDGEELDTAMKRIKQVCGKAFLGAITDDGAESIPALKTPGAIVEFAAYKDEEMLWMVGPLLCAGMTLAEVRRFRERRFDPKGEQPFIDASWTAQEFLALMGPRKKLTRVFNARAGAYAWTMELRPSQEELKAEEAKGSNDS